MYIRLFLKKFWFLVQLDDEFWINKQTYRQKLKNPIFGFGGITWFRGSFVLAKQLGLTFSCPRANKYQKLHLFVNLLIHFISEERSYNRQSKKSTPVKLNAC